MYIMAYVAICIRMIDIDDRYIRIVYISVVSAAPAYKRTALPGGMSAKGRSDKKLVRKGENYV